MQSVRYTMRQVGAPDKVNNVISGEEFAEFLEYTFLSKGYEIYKQVEEPLRGVNNDFLGYRIFVTLVKDSDGDAPAEKAKAK